MVSVSGMTTAMLTKPLPRLHVTNHQESLNQSRWATILSHTPCNAFVYAVISTRIYCRSTCPSRRPRRANVVFFDTAALAEKAGYRACKRCKPESLGRTTSAGNEIEDSNTNPAAREKVKAACDYIAALHGETKLVDVANHVGLSPRYFHGLFKSVMQGVTPGAYAANTRRDKKEKSKKQTGSKSTRLSPPTTTTPSTMTATLSTESSIDTDTTDFLNPDIGPLSDHPHQQQKLIPVELYDTMNMNVANVSMVVSDPNEFMLAFYGDADTYAELNGFSMSQEDSTLCGQVPGAQQSEQDFDFNQPLLLHDDDSMMWPAMPAEKQASVISGFGMTQ